MLTRSSSPVFKSTCVYSHAFTCVYVHLDAFRVSNLPWMHQVLFSLNAAKVWCDVTSAKLNWKHLCEAYCHWIPPCGCSNCLPLPLLTHPSFTRLSVGSCQATGPTLAASHHFPLLDVSLLLLEGIQPYPQIVPGASHPWPHLKCYPSLAAALILNITRPGLWAFWLSACALSSPIVDSPVADPLPG